MPDVIPADDSLREPSAASAAIWKLVDACPEELKRLLRVPQVEKDGAQGKEWMAARRWRLTASMFHKVYDVAKHNISCPELARSLLEPSAWWYSSSPAERNNNLANELYEDKTLTYLEKYLRRGPDSYGDRGTILKKSRYRQAGRGAFGMIVPKNSAAAREPKVRREMRFRPRDPHAGGGHFRSSAPKAYGEEREIPPDQKDLERVEKVGLLVSATQPWLSASPDGLVVDGEGARAVVEVKSFNTAIPKYGAVWLQIHGSMAVASECLGKPIHTGYLVSPGAVQEINFDEKAWNEAAAVLKDFYFETFLPMAGEELAARARGGAAGIS